MRREDLGRQSDGPPTLEDALRVPDLDDGEVVRSLWDDLVIEDGARDRAPDRVARPDPHPDPRCRHLLPWPRRPSPPSRHP